MELSKRMRAVAGMVPRGYAAADIGCDHGFVSIYLVRERICPSVIAADVRPGPLSRAKEHIAQSGLTGAIETVLSDGLEQVSTGPEGAQVMIAAGMGGKLTVKILSAHPEKTEGLSWLVLEPQSEVRLVRRWLTESGFFIAKEDMVLEDGKYYPVILAANRNRVPDAERPAETAGRCREDPFCRESGGGTKQRRTEERDGPGTFEEELKRTGLSARQMRDAQERFGPCLIRERHPVLISYLEHMIAKNAELLTKLPRDERTENGQGKNDQFGQSKRIAGRRKQLLADNDLMETLIRLMTEPDGQENVK